MGGVRWTKGARGKLKKSPRTHTLVSMWKYPRWSRKTAGSSPSGCVMGFEKRDSYGPCHVSARATPMHAGARAPQFLGHVSERKNKRVVPFSKINGAGLSMPFVHESGGNVTKTPVLLFHAVQGPCFGRV